MRTAVLSVMVALLATAAVAQTDRGPSTSDLLQDLRTFEAKVIDADRAFTPAGRKEARARLSVMEENVGAMTPLAIGVEVCRIAALADNGHTGCQSPPNAPSVDLGFYPLNGGIYVFSAAGPETDLIGGRLLAVDGRPISELQKSVRTLAGGRLAWRDLNSSYAYSRPAILHVLGLAREDKAAVYRIRTPDGRIVERRLATAEASAQARGIMPPERTPWSWQDLGTRLRWRDAPDHGAIIVQLRSNIDQPGHPIGAFLDEVERQRAALGRKTVILDLRSNGGGDLTLTREFLMAWPGRVGPRGRFIVLIGPRSFSAALADAAYLKQAGGSQVTLVGQAPGDGMMFFAEGRNEELKSLGLTVRPATERDDLKDGCRHYVDCHAGLAQPGGPTATPPDRAAVIKRIPVAVASLDPDIAAPTTIGDYLQGRDSGLVRALEVARSCRRAAERAACAAETGDLAGPVRHP